MALLTGSIHRAAAANNLHTWNCEERHPIDEPEEFKHLYGLPVIVETDIYYILSNQRLQKSGKGVFAGLREVENKHS